MVTRSGSPGENGESGATGYEVMMTKTYSFPITETIPLIVSDTMFIMSMSCDKLLLPLMLRSNQASRRKTKCTTSGKGGDTGQLMLTKRLGGEG